MSYLVTNPEDRFSREVAHIKSMYIATNITSLQSCAYLQNLFCLNQIN